MFLLQDRLKGLAGKTAASFERVHVVGAGVMGGDIAAWCALRGLSVTLQDRELKPGRAGADARTRHCSTSACRTPAERRRSLDAPAADVAGAGVAEADVVIEAIFEDLDAKARAVRAPPSRTCAADAVLATNTSSLTLETLAPRCRIPGHFVGLHFFNPVAQMPLVEVVHSADTRARKCSTRRSALRAASINCRCLVAAAPAFWSTACCFPTCMRRLHAAGEGIAFDAIDRAAVEFGMPMGPIELCDVVGLDVVLHVGEIVTRELQREAPAFCSTSLRELVQARTARTQERPGLLPLAATARSCADDSRHATAVGLDRPADPGAGE